MIPEIISLTFLLSSFIEFPALSKLFTTIFSTLDTLLLFNRFSKSESFSICVPVAFPSFSAFNVYVIVFPYSAAFPLASFPFASLPDFETVMIGAHASVGTLTSSSIGLFESLFESLTTDTWFIISCEAIAISVVSCTVYVAVIIASSPTAKFPMLIVPFSVV